MANLADVTYKIEGAPEDLGAILQALEANDKRKNPLVKNGFSNMWLGCIITALGGNWEQWKCRGEVYDYRMEDDILIINQSCCWCEQEGFRKFLQEKFPSLTIHYREEECGCELYHCSSFEAFPERYFLDSDCDDPHYWETIEEAAEYISTLVGRKVDADVSALSKAIDNYTEEQENIGNEVFYSFHEFTEVDE
jgi:hypothetical protein